MLLDFVEIGGSQIYFMGVSYGFEMLPDLYCATYEKFIQTL